MRTPYDLLADPEALGLLDLRIRLGLTSDPEELDELEAVKRERLRRRSFAVAGEIIVRGPE